MCAYVGVSQQSADCLTKKQKHKLNFQCITLKIDGAVTTMMLVSVRLNLCEHDSKRQHDAMRWSLILSFIERASVFWLLLSKSVRHICRLKPDTQAALLTAMDFSCRLKCIQETCGQYVKKISDPWTWENARSKRSWSILSCVFWNRSEHKTNKTSSFGLSSQRTVVHSFPLRTAASSNLRIWMQQLKFPYPIFPGRKHTALVELDETLKSLESIQSSKSCESHHMRLV